MSLGPRPTTSSVARDWFSYRLAAGSSSERLYVDICCTRRGSTSGLVGAIGQWSTMSVFRIVPVGAWKSGPAVPTKSALPGPRGARPTPGQLTATATIARVGPAGCS